MDEQESLEQELLKELIDLVKTAKEYFRSKIETKTETAQEAPAKEDAEPGHSASSPACEHRHLNPFGVCSACGTCLHVHQREGVCTTCGEGEHVAS